MTNKEVIERLKWVKFRISEITYSPETLEAISLAIKALEERPTGEWFYDVDHWSCSNCKETPWYETPWYDSSPMSCGYKFCPFCGAKMKGGETNE